jgi:hypothetical protein
MAEFACQTAREAPQTTLCGTDMLSVDVVAPARPQLLRQHGVDVQALGIRKVRAAIPARGWPTGPRAR